MAIGSLGAVAAGPQAHASPPQQGLPNREGHLVRLPDRGHRQGRGPDRRLGHQHQEGQASEVAGLTRTKPLLHYFSHINTLLHRIHQAEYNYFFPSKEQMTTVSQ